jgi:hypothetical protein
MPFDTDRICQSLYAAAESLGTPSAFLTRELTDVILHFLSKDPFDDIPSTLDIAEQVEKIVREVGHPQLARRYAEMQRQVPPDTDKVGSNVTINCAGSPDQFVRDCLQAYGRQQIFSRDVAAAADEGLIHLQDIKSPTSLSTLVLDSPRLAEVDWWLALDDWRACGGQRWIVESPEWLCTGHAHPALTPHLCERLLALPTLADRDIELHLNIADPPAWSIAHPGRPLFSSVDEEELTLQERSNFLDGLLERWKALDAPRMPAIAWHISERSFRDDIERRQTSDLLRLALQGREIRFIFDRPRSPIVLSESLDRRCPGVLLEVGVDLAAMANRPEVKRDGVTLLKKLPSLVRIAVSAAAQKRQYLRGLPDASPLKRRFLIDRATALVTPHGLDLAVHAITGERPSHSPLSLDFAVRILRTLHDTLSHSNRTSHLDLRLDSHELPGAGDSLPLTKQVDIAGKLHAQAGAGTARLVVNADGQIDLDFLRSVWSSSVVRMQLQRASAALQQGELAI